MRPGPGNAEDVYRIIWRWRMIKNKTWAAKGRTGWISGDPQIATQKELETKWSGAKPGAKFYCGFCGYKFKVGDYFRWVFTNRISGAGGNPFTCESCDTKDDLEMAEKRKSLTKEYKRLRNILGCQGE